MATSVDCIIFASKTYSNGEHPLAIRVTKDRKTSYYFLGYTCPANLWEEAAGMPRKKHPNKMLLDAIITKRMAQAKDLVMRFDLEGTPYQASDIVMELSDKKPTKTLFELYESMIQRMVEAKRIGNANAYKDSLRSVKKYTDGKDVKVTAVTYRFLTGFESLYTKRGVKKNTIGAYLRILRAVVNEAIKMGIVKEKDYPFKNFRLGRLKNKSEHRALRKEQIELIEALETDLYSKTWLAKTVFLFAYYNQGINLVDLAQLRWDTHLSEGRLNYTRSKTKDQFSIRLNERSMEILALLDRIRVDAYLFPILNEKVHVNETQKKDRIKKINHEINTNLKEIARLCGISLHLTTYVSRHSYATVLKRAGVSTAVISEGMGHETEAITQHYLDNFDKSVLDEANEYL
jgi:integrase